MDKPASLLECLYFWRWKLWKGSEITEMRLSDQEKACRGKGEDWNDVSGVISAELRGKYRSEEKCHAAITPRGSETSRLCLDSVRQLITCTTLSWSEVSWEFFVCNCG